MPQRFNVNYRDPALSFDPLIDEVFEELQSSFLEMPKGESFTDYQTFEAGYQALKRCTRDFSDVTVENVEAAVMAVPIAFVVFRSVLGFTPPEWAYVTTERTGMRVDHGAARTMDRNVRLDPLTPRSAWGGSLGDQEQPREGAHGRPSRRDRNARGGKGKGSAPRLNRWGR